MTRGNMEEDEGRIWKLEKIFYKLQDLAQNISGLERFLLEQIEAQPAMSWARPKINSCMDLNR